MDGKTFVVEVEQIGEETKPSIVPSPPLPSSPTALTKRVEVERPKPPVKEAPSIPGAGVVKAPLPGVILSVRRQINEKVKAGDILLTLEAMKMENEIYAPISGTIKKIAVSEKEKVGQGDLLAVIE